MSADDDAIAMLVDKRDAADTGERMTLREIAEDLGFDLEKEPKLRHIAHPTDPTIHWCGGSCSARSRGYSNTSTIEGPEVDCPMCADLLRRFGSAWWWDTHCRFYESKCHVHSKTSFHNCAASRGDSSWQD